MIDTIGNILFAFRQKPPILTNPQRILIFKLDHIGDVLMATLAIDALRQRFPKAQIDLVVKQWSASVVQHNPDIDNVIIFNAPWTTRPGQGESRSALYRKIKELRETHYDVALTFRADIRENLTLQLINTPIRIGYHSRGGGFFLTHAFGFDSEIHDEDRMVGLLRDTELIAADQERGVKKLVLSAEHRPHPAIAALKRPVIGIHPGAASARKCWPVDSFAELIHRLSSAEMSVVLLGGPDEAAILTDLKGKIPDDIPVLDDHDGLLDFAATVKDIDLLVCNDSAPLHIAQALGTPLVALFGPTHERLTGPQNSPTSIVLTADVSCRPCWKPGAPFHCPHNFRCFTELSVDQVGAVIQKSINDKV